MEFKEFKLNHDKYKERSFTTSTGWMIEGHFVFDLTRSKLQKEIFKKVLKLIPDLKMLECHLFQMIWESMVFIRHHPLVSTPRLEQLKDTI